MIVSAPDGGRESSDAEPGSRRRWEPAVDYRGDAARQFFEARWRKGDRRVVVVAGLGFDPRTVQVPSLVGEICRDRVSYVLIRENRPDPDPVLVARARANLEMLERSVGRSLKPDTKDIEIFGLGNAVIGGREVAKVASGISLQDVDDVVIDFSAMSIGTSFPLAALLMQRGRSIGCNVHATVVADPSVDAAIRPLPSETAIPVHGFQNGWRLDDLEAASRLWLPQLAHGQRGLLERIFREVAPHDICPILPFPAQEPRRGDLLVEEYLEEIESTWEVDQRSIIYAAESSALDVYRTILNLDEERRPVFDGHGGSSCILSPVGSKILALGSLMAAMERRFPVLYVEAVGYVVNASILDDFPVSGGELTHVWLSGEPYDTSMADEFSKTVSSAS